MKKSALTLTTLFASSLIALSANAAIVLKDDQNANSAKDAEKPTHTLDYNKSGYNAFGDGVRNHPLGQG